MMTESTTHHSHDNGEEQQALSQGLGAFVRIIRNETDALIALLPDALERQWTTSPVPRPSEDTSQRSTGDRPADPTADTVLDARRLAVRETVVRSEAVLRDAAIRTRAVRLAMERAVDRFDGEA